MKKTVKNSIKRMMGQQVFKYSGHYGVVRSVLAGLKELNVSFNYNPKRLNDLGDHVHVLGNVDALRLGIKLKKKGKIHRLTAGPNIVISSAEYSNIVGAQEIDLYTVNSPWTRDAYIFDNEKLKDRINYWYAGIDPSIWSVTRKKSVDNSPRFLFYLKRPEWMLVNECMKVLDKNGLRYDTIQYGGYSIDQLKQKISENDFVVYFVEQESQGIALFEIWSTDTPTFVWNPGYWQYKMKNYRSSSAPYLTEQTGNFFRDMAEFENLIIESKLNSSSYSPRQWILDFGTDKAATINFLNVIGYNLK